MDHQLGYLVAVVTGVNIESLHRRAVGQQIRGEKSR